MINLEQYCTENGLTLDYQGKRYTKLINEHYRRF